MRKSLEKFTVKAFAEGLRAKHFSAREVVDTCLHEIERSEPRIDAFLDIYAEESLKAADAVDRMLADGETLPPLAGVPIALKDVILVKGKRTTGASKILENYIAAYDAHVVKKLKAERAVIIGKTNLDEFAMGSSTENSGFKLTHHPLDYERVPGGSSGGSAAAVASGMALAALGSDTGGSIRQPAAFCGVVGLKTTYGSVSRSGLMALASSLDQIGPITRTVEDASIVFNAICGYDTQDATSSSHDYGDEFLSPHPENARSFTIGIPDEYFIDNLDPLIRESIEGVINRYKNLGVKFKKISLPHTKYALSTYYIILPAEASANLARFDGIRYSRMIADRDVDKRGYISENPREYQRTSALHEVYTQQRALFGPEVKRRIILGTFVLSSGYYDAYYRKAQQVRALIRQDFDEAFKDVQAILTPITPGTAFKIGEKVNDPLSMYMEDMFTLPINLAGVPALALPVRTQMNTDRTQTNAEKIQQLSASSPRESALPVGFQLIGRHFREADILNLGMLYEQST